MAVTPGQGDPWAVPAGAGRVQSMVSERRCRIPNGSRWSRAPNGLEKALRATGLLKHAGVDHPDRLAAQERCYVFYRASIEYLVALLRHVSQVWCQDHILQKQERMLRRECLLVEYVQSRPGDSVSLQCLDQCVLDQYGASRGVDQVDPSVSSTPARACLLGLWSYR